MRLRSICSRLAVSAAALGLVAAGCGGPRLAGPAIDPQRGQVVESPDASALLRFRFDKGQNLRYGLKLQVNTDGVTQVNEVLRAAVFQRCLGEEEEVAPGQDRFFRISFLRHEVERVKKVRENGKDQPPMTAVLDVQPTISDSFGYDPESNSNYYGCTTRGKFGYRGKARFHRVVYDSLVYLLPVLPDKPVKAGDVWEHGIPVYAGPAYFAPQDGWARGNEFELKARFKLEKLWKQGEAQFAYLTWTAEGIFDTHAAEDRYPPRFHERQRIIHEVKAAGSATLDVTRGVMVAKSGQAAVTLTVMTKILRLLEATEEPDWETEVTRHVMNYDCRLQEGGPAPPVSP